MVFDQLDIFTLLTTNVNVYGLFPPTKQTPTTKWYAIVCYRPLFHPQPHAMIRDGPDCLGEVVLMLSVRGFQLTMISVHQSFLYALEG